ncbi:MAG: hypothetical protein RLY97_395, partial [Pseudomonadota bacterium]
SSLPHGWSRLYAGPAFTAHIPAGDNLWIHRALYQAAKGDILNEAAMAHGLGGLVIDGGVRDVAGLSAMIFPIFSNVICLKGTIKGYDATAWTRQPIRIGDVVVTQGDLIVGDRDGVVVLPVQTVAKTLEFGALRERGEADKITRITAGTRTLDLYGFGEAGNPV